MQDLGLPKFRADQIARQYYGRLVADPEQMTDLPAQLRSAVAESLFPPLLTEVRHVVCDAGATRKTLWRAGDGTLLDRTVVMALSECGYAKQHTLESIPVFLAGGKGSGKIKTGIHVAAAGEPGSRIGLTVQQALGLSVNSWGVGSMRTARPLTELFV